jgi:hypothetical protein
MQTVRERDVEKHLVKKVKEAGGEIRKVQWIGRRGAPDRLVLLPGYRRLGESAHRDVHVAPRTLWIELKKPGEKPEPHQSREHDRMRGLGQIVLVIDSFEGVEALFR